VSLLAAGFFLAYLIAVSPHLVHHAFEDHQTRPTCPLLIQSQQTMAEPQHGPSPIVPVVLAEIVAARTTVAALPLLIPLRLPPRAPPRLPTSI
jgi:hypothetical protein